MQGLITHCGVWLGVTAFESLGSACGGRCDQVVFWLQVLQQEEYEFSDPVTQFLTCLYVDFDFEGAQQKLAECETVLENDFFLTALKVSRQSHSCGLSSFHQARNMSKANIASCAGFMQALPVIMTLQRSASGSTSDVQLPYTKYLRRQLRPHSC